MTFTRRATFPLLSLTLALGALSPLVHASTDDELGLRSDMVFTSTNATSGNELLVYAADKSGSMTLQSRWPTLGAGTGTGLGNQGAVTLSSNGRYIFVVNAQSNTVSTFTIHRHGLELRSTVDSGGLRPVSVTERQGLVYVLNGDGDGNVAGFRNDDGQLKPISGGTRALSMAGGTAPAQVGFNPDGTALLVTEKATNALTSYAVREGGRLGQPKVTVSAGMTPFGFAFSPRGQVLISEAFGGAADASAVSSYSLSAASAKPRVISPSVGTTQTAACWVVISPNGRHAYTTNTASGTVSRYAVAKTGDISLAEGVAATVGAGPIDAAVSANGKALFVLNSGSQSISSLVIGADGSLSASGQATGLPAGANGLAAN